MDGEKKRVREIYASSMTWWWWIGTDNATENHCPLLNQQFSFPGLSNSSLTVSVDYKQPEDNVNKKNGKW